MKRIGLLTIAVAVTVAACGGSDDVVVEPDLEVAAVDEEGLVREAGGDVRVINGCRIESKMHCIGVDLSGVDLSGLDLQMATLTRAVLRNVNFREADLRNADLNGAVLTGADLSGADLRFSVLRNANLSGAVVNDTTNLEFTTRCKTTMPDGAVWNSNC